MKYMGSKARLSKDLAPIINELITTNNIKTYIEPFVGGANMIQHIQCENKIGADNNKYLIAMWNRLQQGWSPPKEITRDFYNDIKTQHDQYPDELVAVAGFCATYNAKWFGGYAGLVSTKIGTVRNYYDEAVRNILKQLKYLNDVQFIESDYSDFSDTKGALIYCDPPYRDTTKYNKDGFDHDAFWNWVRLVSEYNIVIVSEYTAPDDFKTTYEKQLINSLNKSSRKTNTEKLFILEATK